MARALLCSRDHVRDLLRDKYLAGKFTPGRGPNRSPQIRRSGIVQFLKSRLI